MVTSYRYIYIGLLTSLLLLTISCGLFQEADADFNEIPEPPSILSVEPNIFISPIAENLVIAFTASKYADRYEVWMEGQQLIGTFDPLDPETLNEGDPIVFTAYPSDPRNTPLRYIHDGTETKMGFVRAANEFQYSNSDPFNIDFCLVVPPKVRGFQGACSKTPCENVAVVFLSPIEWEVPPFTSWFDYEIYQAASCTENLLEGGLYTCTFPQADADTISTDLWQDSFTEDGRIIYPPTRVTEEPKGIMVGYGRTQQTFADLSIPNPNLPNQQALVPGHYYIRVRSFNEKCYSSWSQPFLFHFYEGWNSAYRQIASNAIMLAEGIAVDNTNQRLYVSNNGGIPTDNLGNLVLNVGTHNVQTFSMFSYSRFSLGGEYGIFGYDELAGDGFGNDVDGITVDEESNVYFASDQTGYIYKYNKSLQFDRRIGRGVSTPPNPEVDSLFWGIDYDNGKIYAADANDYDDDSKHYRYVFVFDAKTGVEEKPIPITVIASKKPASEMWGVTVDSCTNYLIVSDNDDAYNVVRVFDLATRKELYSFDPSVFTSPIGVSVGCNGILYIMDGSFGINKYTLKVFLYLLTPTEAIPLTWEETVLDVGYMLWDGRGVAVDNWHRLYVTNDKTVNMYLPYNINSYLTIPLTEQTP